MKWCVLFLRYHRTYANLPICSPSEQFGEKEVPPGRRSLVKYILPASSWKPPRRKQSALLSMGKPSTDMVTASVTLNAPYLPQIHRRRCRLARISCLKYSPQQMRYEMTILLCRMFHGWQRYQTVRGSVHDRQRYPGPRWGASNLCREDASWSMFSGVKFPQHKRTWWHRNADWTHRGTHSMVGTLVERIRVFICNIDVKWDLGKDREM